MKKKVHILNGDSTLFGIQEGGLEGEVIVWREVLCEGTISHEIGTDNFWKERYAFFEKELGVSKMDYYDKTIKELVKIEDLSTYNEVVLWFEYDLFCQVNLLALCSYLLKYYRKDISYYLICVGAVKDSKALKTLGDIPPAGFRNLYENKTKLSRNDLRYAAECWEIYTRNIIEELEHFNFNKNKKFRYLQKAMDQHAQRFKDGQGLNQIDRKILEIIDKNTFTEGNIIKELLVWQQQETVYGFGDLQYFGYLKKLEKYYQVSEEIYELNDLGRSMIAPQ